MRPGLWTAPGPRLISDNIDTYTGMRLAGVDAEEALTFAAKRFTQRLEADET